MPAPRSVDALVVGGGFYGCAIALHLRGRGAGNVLLVEREKDLLLRASFNNQARVHNGYHYPRSFVTGFRSRTNYRRFCAEYPFAVRNDFTMLYAIARRRSSITPGQFERFARDIGAPLHPAPRELVKLFEPDMIAQVYVAEECAFDAALLRAHFHRELARVGVDVALGTEAIQFERRPESVGVTLDGPEGRDQILADLVINCTYSGLNQLLPAPKCIRLKFEIAEIALVDPPPELTGVGVTVMDGPFFSLMPFPAGDCHSLSHVRYTPHGHWTEGDTGRVGSQTLDRPSRAHFMVADATRYLPCAARVRYRNSLFEEKAMLVRNEADDGRPILMRPEAELPGVISILGGKIDNIFDVCERLDGYLARIIAS